MKAQISAWGRGMKLHKALAFHYGTKNDRVHSAHDATLFVVPGPESEPDPIEALDADEWEFVKSAITLAEEGVPELNDPAWTVLAEYCLKREGRGSYYPDILVLSHDRKECIVLDWKSFIRPPVGPWPQLYRYGAAAVREFGMFEKLTLALVSPDLGRYQPHFYPFMSRGVDPQSIADLTKLDTIKRKDWWWGKRFGYDAAGAVESHPDSPETKE